MKPTVSVIIPVRNQLAFTRQCLAAIRTYTPLPHEVIFVDNDSTDGTTSFLRKRVKQEVGSTWIRNPVNRGFAAAVNQGMKKAQGEYFLLLNNDTLVSSRWMELLLAVLRSDVSIGMTGPVSNKAIPEQKVSVRLSRIPSIHRYSQFHNRHNPGLWRETRRLSGFCLAIPRRIWEEVGEWDERFGLGTYEDDDYSYRVRKAGYRLIVAGDTYVHHFGSRSFRRRGRAEFLKILAQNRHYFLRKWDLPEPPGGLL
ncbi:glycosyltransferase family 2 protein [Salinithrix halophila]|uniref:Glycosyltransferase family 2 protein n=1 Tax=Salinithrix halophila TaxID=1485204 RepID=A0ABV8JH89_9BACL